MPASNNLATPRQNGPIRRTGRRGTGKNFLLRYWEFAKDSAARKAGLACKDLPGGGDAAKLP
jgi:hypothetical protein